ncbi:MAG: gliding motility-associated ABC transporter ATP-binding subunit GldA [Bacteroidetes bacterium]|nr:gliding motility-associated ABC transporter ATP-binding subunit GldA [Bacteroidota bacterium]HET6243877.1 gliding motility-associated ABC transporter ATP-binding subunit GldA [Bacteroidia bacterium]
MSIVIKNITKLYESQKALDEVSFEVNTGGIVGFLGPNGAGKSTMMKIITCFIPQNSGTVTVNGFDTLEHSMEVKKITGYLPEHNPLYLDMYVKEYLEFIAGLHHVPNIKNRIKEMIEMTGLEVEQKKKIGQLSKGYRQRVGLAQALIHDPKVLILDEPTTGLDPNQLGEIRALIKSIGKEKTVMLSTHIMQEVEAICDRVIIINNGKIVADSPVAEINGLMGSQQFYLVEFGGIVSRSNLKKIAGVYDAIQINEGENTWQIQSSSSQDIRSSLFNYGVENKIPILTMHKQERKLEDVFKQLTKK